VQILDAKDGTLAPQFHAIVRIGGSESLTRLNRLEFALLVKVELSVVKITLELGKGSHVDITSLNALTSIVVGEGAIEEAKVSEREEEGLGLHGFRIATIVEESIFFRKAMARVGNHEHDSTIDKEFDDVLFAVIGNSNFGVGAQRVAITTALYFHQVSKSRVFKTATSAIASHTILIEERITNTLGLEVHTFRSARSGGRAAGRRERTALRGRG
jgi:hypothetical protein